MPGEGSGPGPITGEAGSVGPRSCRPGRGDAGAVPALVLLAAFGSLRWGELAALRRSDVDVEQGTVRVDRSLTELAGGGYVFGPPKSTAGKRMVVVPAVIRPALSQHLATFTASQPDALVFTSSTGVLLRDGNFRRRVWRPALAKAGLSGTHFHDLRHTVIRSRRRPGPPCES